MSDFGHSGTRRGKLLRLAAALAGASLGAAGCAPERNVIGLRAATEPAAAHAPTTVILARPGRMLVVPVKPSPEDLARASMSARLDRGQMLYAPLYWIGERRSSPAWPAGGMEAGTAAIASRARAWMGIDGDWEAAPVARAGTPEGKGSWAVVMDIPANAAGQGIWVAEKRLMVGRLRAGAGNLWTEPPRRAQPDSVWWREAMRSARRSPQARWRARLAAGESGERGAQAADAFTDLIVERWADQVEDQWRAALARLRQADAAAAGSVAARLTQATDFGGGVAMPTWGQDARQLETLLADLLWPDHSPAQIAQQAKDWLLLQPDAAAWVLDDAGTMDAVGGAVSTVGVANLDPVGAAAAAWAAPTGAAAGEIRMVRECTAATVSSVGPRTATGSTELTVRIGDWASSRHVLAGELAATPPGFVVGPLSPDWDQMRWLGACSSAPGASGAAAAEATTAGMLMRDDRVRGGTMQSEPERRWKTQWVLYLECRVGPGESSGQDEVVVFLGPTDRPRTTLRVFADGRMIETRPGAHEASSTRVRTVAAEDRWSCWAPIPEAAIGEDQILRIGVMRVDGTGERTAWPRPMMPWQNEPGRVAVDLGAWGSAAE